MTMNVNLSPQLEAMVKAKCARCGASLAQLSVDGQDYTPALFSCYWRPHPDARRVLEPMAQIKRAPARMY
jgi:hypothetical protein